MEERNTRFCLAFLGFFGLEFSLKGSRTWLTSHAQLSQPPGISLLHWDQEK